MRFFVPEWDDAVDARYDFIHDELSTLNKKERDRHFIWDIFDYETTPIDGVLVSREQIEGSQKKFDRITGHGVYNDPQLTIPEWLPTISDCGAWGYKSLPFPRYGNGDMLEFYESLGVTVGVTIDHLVLGSGKEEGRLYLDKRAFGDDFTQEELPDRLTDKVDIMVDEWPNEWPDIVARYDATICGINTVEKFTEDDFSGTVSEILDRMDFDSRAVYREDDKQVRYDITLENALEIKELYDDDEWSFRLMAAFQGWDPESYTKALSEILDMGYQYVGVGGVAGSQLAQVEEIVKEVGNNIATFEAETQTRIDTHVFGFAKSDGFDTIGRSRVSSIDSASMLRAAWTGGKNYHLTSGERYDAVRVRYASSRDDFETAIRKSLHGQEVLRTLRAYGNGESVVATLEQWSDEKEQILPELETYLRKNRHRSQFDLRRLRDVTEAFRADFEYGYELQANYSDDLRKKIIKLLRKDGEEDPIDFDEYRQLIHSAEEIDTEFPRNIDRIIQLESESGEVGTFKQMWVVLEDYAQSDEINDADLLEDYRRTLRARPWERCDCPICAEHGIEVAIFRGNNRNRRRGFHNTYRFYEDFKRELPKILVVTDADSSFINHRFIENYLNEKRPEFWASAYDLPVAEIGVIDANGIYEWWDQTPARVSLEPDRLIDQLIKQVGRYDLILYHGRLDTDHDSIKPIDDPKEIRDIVLGRLGYDSDFMPKTDVQIQLGEY